MSSIVLNWVEINAYRTTIGPGLNRPPRPSCCPACDATRVWFDGWSRVHAVVLADGVPYRFDDALPLQRVVCSRCGASWTLRPPFLYPHRVYQPDVNEAAMLAYLSDASATYDRIAAAMGCSPRSVWRWIGWLATLVAPALLIAAIAAVDPGAGSVAAESIPREVPQDHAKARSPARAAALLRGLQTLRALVTYARVQIHPPDDPSALRFWLTARFLAFRQRALLTRPGLSPPSPEAVGVPSG